MEFLPFLFQLHSSTNKKRVAKSRIEPRNCGYWFWSKSYWSQPEIKKNGKGENIALVFSSWLLNDVSFFFHHSVTKATVVIFYEKNSNICVCKSCKKFLVPYHSERISIKWKKDPQVCKFCIIHPALYRQSPQHPNLSVVQLNAGTDKFFWPLKSFNFTNFVGSYATRRQNPTPSWFARWL